VGFNVKVSTSNDLLQAKIEKWKRDLIDLTNRNVLLNFRPKKNKTLQFFEEPQELFDQLVKESKNLNVEELQNPIFEQIQKIMNSKEEEQVKRKKIAVEKELFNKLVGKLRLDARTRLNEQGIQTLYLVFGVLKWKEQGNEKEFLSPLLLVPVELNRSSANQPFRVKMVDDEIVLNPFMAHKLREEKGITLPELSDQEDADIGEIWDKVSGQIDHLEGWSVSSEIYLSLFSFSKLVMYKDLEIYRNLLENHPLIGKISGVEPEGNINLIDLSSVPDESELDRKVPAEESYQVLDADSSQQQAIIAAKNGVSFVLQGPPGTGKSQTISNIIAECLAVNKKVLFVSEKMAALEVVKSRLEQVGLGEFCLELHSHKANKRSVLDAFQQAINSHPKHKQIQHELYSNINHLRNKLNTYSETLHQIWEPFGKSAYEIHGTLAKLDQIQEILFDFEIDESINYENILSLLIDLERYRGRLILTEQTPVWKGFKKSVYSLELASKLESFLRESLINLDTIIQQSQSIQRTLSLSCDSVEDIRQNHSIIEMAKYSPNPPKHWFNNESIQLTIQKAREYQEKMSTFLEEKSFLTTIFHPEILEKDITNIFVQLFMFSEDFFKAFGSEDPKLLIQEREIIIDMVEQARASLQTLNDLGSIQDEFGLPPIKKLEDVNLLNGFMSVILKNPRPTRLWFCDLAGVTKSIQEAKKRFLDWGQKRDKMNQKYDSSILELDLYALRQNIETQGNELFPLFTSTIQSDTKDDELFNKQVSIQDRIGKFLLQVQQFDQVKPFISESLEAELPNLKSVSRLKPMMELIVKDPRPTSSWFQSERQNEIYSFIQESKNIHRKYQQELSATLEIYEEEVLEDRIFQMLERFETTYQSSTRIFNGSFHRDRKWLSSKLKQKDKYDFDSLSKQVRSAKRVLDYKKWMEDHQSDFRTYFGRHYKGLETEWNRIEDSFSVFQEIQQMFPGSIIPVPLKEILIQSTVRLEQLISEFERLALISNEIKVILESLHGDFPNLFMKRSAQPVEQWTITESVNEIMDLQLKLQAFYTNTQKLLDVRKPGTVSRLSLQELLKDIDLSLSIIQLKNVIMEQEPQLKDLMGFWYKTELTPWELVEQALTDVEKLSNLTPVVPEKFQTLLIEDSFNNYGRHSELERSVQTLDQTISVLSKKVPFLFQNFKNHEIKQWEIDSITNCFKWFHESLQQWSEQYDGISGFFKRDYLIPSELKEDLQEAIVVQEQKIALEADLDYLKDTFGHFFSGYTTNWDVIFDALAWLEDWMQHFAHREVPGRLVAYISEGANQEQKQELLLLFEESRELLKHHDELFHQLVTYFEEEILMVECLGLQRCSLSSYHSWINQRVHSMEQLEEWIRYQRLEKRIRDAQLSSFLEHLEIEKPSKGSFVQLFQKRFYRKCLDQIYQDEEILYDFDAEIANTAIMDFRESDVKSLDQNAIRVQEILEQKRKHAIDSLSYRREQGVLLHEIGKKKRHLAIRKLLSQTSALALEVKPCFLMSPLSVSQYLDANDIAFDVVIFDEASQIFPEEAIGSIFRASQVIIVGDNKQLPPTDFFKAGGVGEEFEDENEVEYESILDECMYALENMRLRWHYRSRHESLISFANTAFYSNSLITFPSSEHGYDLGVKFVHVPDGLYDRGGTRSNIREAEITAELVFEHFRHHPNRSLGVIAFSDAQATEIRDQIDRMRRNNPSMELFFKEGKHDEFFVKSLENVQGDERDVIFFSIGYGKAPDGSLHMNFGPLSKNGGERRLNVAITRAKYHVKLISSLLPQDIPLERTQSIGIHRLRDYMEMAMNGHLPVYTSSNTVKMYDSPFEEDVYDVLVGMGYEVHTQVGASGYKIDLAIVDPHKPDSYLCAIECDGKTYHSSKVARDRDRLRQQVLENLGWKIHRIWSQEWFKKRNFEITRLKNLFCNLEGR
jgi:very-short-patch-repair endonuclease